MTDSTGGSKDVMNQIRAGAQKSGAQTFAEQLGKPTMDDQGFTVPMGYLSLTRNIRGEVVEDDEFQALCDSIKQYGQLQAVIVQLIDDKPTLVAGYRRYAAMTKLGLTHIRVTGKNIRHDWEMMQVFENLHRSDLPAIRFCESVLLVHNKHPDDTMEELAKRIGLKDRGQATFFLKIARWPDDVKKTAHEQGLSRRALVEIARQKQYGDPEALRALFAGNTDEGEKKPGTEEAPINAKNELLRSRLSDWLDSLPKKFPATIRKDAAKIAEKVAAMQPEERAALLKALRTLNTQLED